jgi:hypothetical protein
MPFVCRQLAEATGHEFLSPVIAQVPATAPLGILATACARQVIQLHGRRAQLVVVILDRENRDDCCGELAAALETRIAREAEAAPAVVIKNRMYENWLVADVEALKQMRRRFSLSRTSERAIVPDKADNVDALRLLKQSAIGSEYSKVLDSQRILERADVMRMGANSRSFRRFMRVTRHPSYTAQSRRA